MGVLHRLADELRATWRVVLRELSVFGAVGLFNLGVDIAVFNLCTLVFDLDALSSKALATAVSATSAYFMHRGMTFAHRARTGFRREYGLFFLFNAIALVLGLAVIAAAQYVVDLDDALSLNLANLVAVGVGTAFRFWTYKRWVFPAVARVDGELAAR